MAVELGKIASDLRLLSMGPRAGHRGNACCRPCSPVRRSCRARSIRRCPRWSTRSATRCIGCDTTVTVAADAGPARAERDDAGDRVERAARADDSHERDDDAARAHASTASRPTRARARAARSQHRGRDGAQPVHRLRGHSGDREGGGRERAPDPRYRARERAADARRSRSRSSAPRR